MRRPTGARRWPRPLPTKEPVRCAPSWCYRRSPARPPRFNKRVRLLWIGAGTGEEAIHTSAKGMHEALGRAGIETVFVEQTGTAHEWQTWRKALYDFAPRLFNE